jgi:hypothetical protein
MPQKTIVEDRPGGHILSEDPGRRSREQVTLGITAVPLPSGTVLGKITATGLYVPLAPAAGDGSQNFAGVLWERREINAATQRAVVHNKDCEVNGREVTYINALTAPQLATVEAAAANLGVVIRY